MATEMNDRSPAEYPQTSQHDPLGQPPSSAPANPSKSGMSAGLIGLALLPLVLLAGLVYLLVETGGGLLPSDAPPVEELTIDRIALPAEGEMIVHVTNGGPSPVTVAQVLVDDAYWNFEIEPANLIPRLSTAEIRIPYPWVATEPHEVVLLTSTGVTFASAVEVSLAQPTNDLDNILRFLLLGFYVGVVPVGLGLLWYPVVKRSGKGTLVFVMSLTLGLLLFLLLDTLFEALEVGEALPEGFHAKSLIWLIFLLTIVFIEAVGTIGRGREGMSPMGLAGLIAFGIGLHNFGEGLAIGSAYTLGEIALGAFLVVGFTLHNVTEGLAIAAPLTQGKPRLRDFLALGILAGAPAMLGTWIGAYAYSATAAALFLAVGAGAIGQVIYRVGLFTLNAAKGDDERRLGWLALGGLVAGVVIMYGTALFIAA
jgi:ZIP family zinc transporter